MKLKLLIFNIFFPSHVFLLLRVFLSCFPSYFSSYLLVVFLILYLDHVTAENRFAYKMEFTKIYFLHKNRTQSIRVISFFIIIFVKKHFRSCQMHEDYLNISNISSKIITMPLVTLHNYVGTAFYFRFKPRYTGIYVS